MEGHSLPSAALYVFWFLTIASWKSTFLSVVYGDIDVPVAANVHRFFENTFVDDGKKKYQGTELTSCVLSNSGGYFTASFLSAVGMDNMMEQDEWPCHTLFVFTGASSAICTWMDKKTVHALLAPSATSISSSLQPGDRITHTQTLSSVLLSPPIQIQKPIVLMTVPTAVGVYDNLLIDLSASWGHLGRPWINVAWTVTLLNSTSSSRSIDSSSSNRRFVDDFVEYLTMHFDPITARVNVPLYLWKESTDNQPTMNTAVSLTVSLTNYLHESSSDTRVVLIDSGSDGSSSHSRGDDLVASRYRRNGQTKVPLVSILGPRSVTIKAREGLQLEGVARIPTSHPRGSNTNDNHQVEDTNNLPTSSLFYSWFVDRIVNGTKRESANDLIVENRDPRRFMMIPYSMLAGERYVVTMMVQTTDDEFNELSAVNCSVEVIVTSGRVVALLSGGDHRQISVGSELTIDAGLSYDEDLSHLDGWMLNYQWSCETTKLSTKNVHDATVNWSKCPFTMTTATSPSLLVVPSNTLSVDSMYRIQVIVISADGTRHSNPTSVLITAVAAVSMDEPTLMRMISMIPTTSNARINIDQQMVLPGEVLFDGSVKATWSIVSTLSSIMTHTNNDISINSIRTWPSSNGTVTTLTPLEKNMIMSIPSEVTNSQMFPLAISPWAFARTPGMAYTFRLAAQSLLTSTSSTSSSSTVYSEIVLTVNTPPTGGLMRVSPADGGQALSTLFTLTSIGWTDEITDMPLTYSFQYQLSPLLPMLDIVGSTASTTITSMLPAGITIESQHTTLVVVGRVMDAFQATANASIKVLVRKEKTGLDTSNTTMNRVATFLVAGLHTGLTASDADQTLRTVNLAASALYRGTSKIGHNTNMTLQSTCSGHGTCSFVDVAGNPTTTVFDTTMTEAAKTVSSSPCVVCVCNDGYGGADCSLTPAELTARNAMRLDMCSSLVEVTSSQDKSASLYDALLRSLSVVFDPYEVFSDNGRVACSYVLRYLANVLREGYLPTQSIENDRLFAQVVSSFLEVFRIPQGSIEDTEAAAVYEDHVRIALGGLTSSLRNRIVEGQSPLTITAPNVRAVVRYGLSSTSLNGHRANADKNNANNNNDMTEIHAVASLSNTATASSAFALSTTRLAVNPQQLSSVCDINAADAKTTMLHVYGVNLHLHGTNGRRLSELESKETISPSLQISITNAAVTKSDPMRSQSNLREVANVPAYYITMPFAAPQDYVNATALRRRVIEMKGTTVAVESLETREWNTSQLVPRCMRHDGEKYIPCQDCNISSLTLTNVTFACYDIQALCHTPRSPTDSKATSTFTGMYNFPLDLFQNDVEEAEEMGDMDPEPYLSSILDASIDPRSRALGPKGGGKKGGGGGKKGGGRTANKQRSANKANGKSDDANNNTQVADDGGYPPADDMFKNSHNIQITELTVLMPTCLGWVETVLHENPIKDFGRKSAAGIWLVIGFSCAIIVGTTFFMRWDKMDRHEAIYLAEYKEKILEHIVRQSLQTGGHGLVREYVTVRGLKLPRKEGPVQQRMKGLLMPKQRGADGGTVATPLLGGGKASALSSSSPSSREQGIRLPSRLPHGDGQPQGSNNNNPGEEDMLLEEVDIEGGAGRLSDTDNSAPDPSAAGGGGGWSLSLPGLTTGSAGSGGGALWWANNPFGNSSPISEGYTPPSNRRIRDRGGDSYYPTNRDAELDTKKLNLDTLLKSNETDDIDPIITNGGNSFSNPYGAKYNGMDLDDPLTMSVVVERFIDSVLPGKELFETGIDAKDGEEDRQDLDSTWNMLKLLVRNHSLIRMSGANTRTSRWFGVVHGLLISLFFDTLFFVTFFPPQNPCGNYGNSRTCHTLPSKILEGATMCVWDPDLKICYLQPPPSSIYFTLIVTLMVVLVIVPLEGFLGLVFEGFVVKRPDLEMWGLNTDSWFGSTQLPGTKVIKSPMALLLEAKNLKSAIAKDKADKAAAAAIGLEFSKKYESGKTLRAWDVEQQESWDISVGDRLKNDGIAMCLYSDQCSEKVEAEILLEEVRNYIRKKVPTFNSVGVDAESTREYATTEAIQRRLKINVDGRPLPLTLYERLFYRDPVHMLEWKIRRKRWQCSEMFYKVMALRKVDQKLRDAALVRAFVLECIGFWNKLALENILFNFRDQSSEKVHPILWILASLFTFGFNAFLLYWIYVWGAYMGNNNVQKWGVFFGISTAQDVCFVEFCKCFLLTVGALMSARPQLRAIRRVINDICMQLLQEGESQSTDVCVAQHLSPTCRAARTHELQDLPASAILRRVTDAHVQACHENRNNFSGVGIFICIAVPALLNKLNPFVMDQVIGIFLSILVIQWLLLVQYLYDLQPEFELILFTGVPAFLFYMWVVAPKARRKAQRLRRQKNKLPGPSQWARIIRRSWRKADPNDLIDPYTLHVKPWYQRVYDEFRYCVRKFWQCVVFVHGWLPQERFVMAYIEKPAKWKQQWIQMNQQPRVPIYINPQVLARAAADQEPFPGDEGSSNEGNGSSLQEMLGGGDLLKGMGVINGLFGGTVNVLTKALFWQDNGKATAGEAMEEDVEKDYFEGFNNDNRYGKTTSLNRTLQTLIQGLPQEIITMHNQVAARTGSRLVFKRTRSGSSSASSSGESDGYANAFNATSLLGLRKPQQSSPGIVPFSSPIRGVSAPRSGRQPYDLFGKSKEERMAKRPSSSSSSVASSNELSPSMINGGYGLRDNAVGGVRGVTLADSVSRGMSIRARKYCAVLEATSDVRVALQRMLLRHRMGDESYADFEFGRLTKEELAQYGPPALLEDPLKAMQNLIENKSYLPPRPLVTPLDSAVVDLFQDFTQYTQADDYVLLTELVELIDWVWTTGGPTGGTRLAEGGEAEGGNITGMEPKKQQKRKKFLLPKDARLPRVKLPKRRIKKEVPIKYFISGGSFYPGNRPMAAAERSEVVERLMEWWMVDYLDPADTPFTESNLALLRNDYYRPSALSTAATSAKNLLSSTTKSPPSPKDNPKGTMAGFGEEKGLSPLAYSNPMYDLPADNNDNDEMGGELGLSAQSFDWGDAVSLSDSSSGDSGSGGGSGSGSDNESINDNDLPDDDDDLLKRNNAKAGVDIGALTGAVSAASTSMFSAGGLFIGEDERSPLDIVNRSDKKPDRNNMNSLVWSRAGFATGPDGKPKAAAKTIPAKSSDKKQTPPKKKSNKSVMIKVDSDGNDSPGEEKKKRKKKKKNKSKLSVNDGTEGAQVTGPGLRGGGAGVPFKVFAAWFAPFCEDVLVRIRNGLIDYDDNDNGNNTKGLSVKTQGLGSGWEEDAYSDAGTDAAVSSSPWINIPWRITSPLISTPSAKNNVTNGSNGGSGLDTTGYTNPGSLALARQRRKKERNRATGPSSSFSGSSSSNDGYDSDGSSMFGYRMSSRPSTDINGIKNEGYGYAGLGMATAAATEVTVNTVGGFSELVTLGTVQRTTLRSYTGLDNNNTNSRPFFYGPRSYLATGLGQGPGRERVIDDDDRSDSFAGWSSDGSSSI